ncbi:MAG: c-type cytochrome [Candidatus Binatia bacterium]
MKASILVVVLTGIFVWCGELLTAASGAGGGGAGGEVGVARGEALFFGKGKCYTCHSIGGRGSAVRCPNLGVFGEQFRQPVGIRAAERKRADGYSAIEYLVESLYDPNAFVVPGFPKGLMPAINRPPIGLDGDEIASVILFLLAESDSDTDAAARDEIRTAQRTYATLGADAEAPPAAISLPRGNPQSGRDLFPEFGCTSCHRVRGVNFHLEEPVSEGGVGPDLTSIGAVQTREYLVESLLDPNAVVVANPPGVELGAEGAYADAKGWSKMPKFADVMTVEQMLDLAQFLKTLTGEEGNAKLYP